MKSLPLVAARRDHSTTLRYPQTTLNYPQLFSVQDRLSRDKGSIAPLTKKANGKYA